MFGGMIIMGNLNQILSNWQEVPLEGPKTMINKYGYPDEATQSRLIWFNNGPWKRMIVYRDTVPHHFPTPHEDFLKQTINYQVPLHFCMMKLLPLMEVCI